MPVFIDCDGNNWFNYCQGGNMKYIVRLDFWIINLFEKISQLTVTWVGLNNVFLARLAYLGCCLSLFFGLPKFNTATIFIVAVISLAAFGSLYTGTITEEISKKKNDAYCKGYSNWKKQDKPTMLLRIIILLGAISCFFLPEPMSRETHGLFPVVGLCFGMGNYFLGCNSKPYTPSKLKKWMS